MKLSLILEAIDRVTGPARRVTAAVRGIVNQGIQPLQRAMAAVDRASGGFLSTMGGRLSMITAKVRALAGRAGMWALEKASYGAGFAIGWATRKLVGLIATAAKWTAIAATAGVALFTRGIIGNAAQFEQFQVQLEGTEGSAAKAKASMAWIQKFAKDTPYQIEEVTNAFVRARGIGLDPLTGAFRILGDAASGTNKTIMDAIEMMADAQTGEFERLKEFNITTSVKGSTVTFSYLDKAGKNATKSVKKSMAEIRGAILGVLDDKYGGGMGRLSSTFTGIWNNLSDVITNFELQIARAGIFDRVKAGLQGILEWTDRVAADGSLNLWAKQISDWLVKIWDDGKKFVSEVDWKGVGGDIRTVADALWGAVKAVAELVRLSSQARENFMNYTPTGWVLKAVGLGGGSEEPVVPKPSPPGTTVPALPFRQTSPWRVPGAPAPAAKPGAAPRGLLSIDIRTAPGTTATPRKISATGIDLRVNTGKSMDEAA